MEQKQIKLFPVLLVLGLAALGGLLIGCGGPSKEALPVDNLSRGVITKVENTDNAEEPPVTYSVKVSWSLASITDDEKASEALTGLYASVSGSGNETKLQRTDTEYTFTGIEPGERYYLGIRAAYAPGTYEDGDGAREEVGFIGGPWHHSDVEIGEAGYDTASYSVGSFNQEDDYPTSTFTLDEFYYYNTYNTEYVLEEEGHEVWMIVAVKEVTDTNDTDTQRDNINWLSNEVYLLDANVPDLTDYSDIPYADLEIYTVTGEKLFELTGTVTEGTIAPADFNTLLDSVNSGYYADKEGVFYVRAICTAVPDTYSEDNEEDKYGWWGLALPGPRVTRD